MQKNIVILGAGFGGIKAAKVLARTLCGREGWRIVLVDRNPFHIYYPKLFEEVIPHGQVSTVKAGQADVHRQGGAGRCQVSMAEILEGTSVDFVQATVERVDCKAQVVEVKGDKLSYDYLILALGAEADYFGIPGLKEHAIVLRGTDDAEKIREKVAGFLHSVISTKRPEGARGEISHDTSMQGVRSLASARDDESCFEVMIGGAGATGVELAALLAYRFRNISRDRWSVTLVEALPRVLSMFPNELSQYAHTRLEKLGVHLMLDTCMKEVKVLDSAALRSNNRNFEVVLAPRPMKPGESENDLVCDFLPEHEKRVQPDLLIWTGGVRANPLLGTCGMAVDRKGRLEVDEHLRVKGMDRVFAIGDNALLVDPATKQPVAGTAQAALAEAEIAAHNIVATIQGKTPVLYSFPKFSAIVPLAGRDGVALIGTRVLRGFFAWILRQGADCRYFASVTGWWKAARLCLF